MTNHSLKLSSNADAKKKEISQIGSKLKTWSDAERLNKDAPKLISETLKKLQSFLSIWNVTKTSRKIPPSLVNFKIRSFILLISLFSAWSLRLMNSFYLNTLIHHRLHSTFSALKLLVMMQFSTEKLIQYFNFNFICLSWLLITMEQRLKNLKKTKTLASYRGLQNAGEPFFFKSDGCCCPFNVVRFWVWFPAISVASSKVWKFMSNRLKFLVLSRMV